MNKLVTKYQKLIRSNKMTKAEINGMRKALGHCSRLTPEDKDAIRDTLEAQIQSKGGIRITKEHTVQGLNYLKAVAFTTKGMPRKTKNYPFGEKELDVLRKFKTFKLVGLEELDNGYGTIWGYSPIWRVESKTRRFDYVQKGRWMPVEVI